jgi:hypothetical protein
MEKRLESVMNEVKSLRVQAGQSAVPDACAFVKTSCRSPKDTVLFNTTFKQGIIDALHSQTHAFGRAVTEATENGLSIFHSALNLKLFVNVLVRLYMCS